MPNTTPLNQDISLTVIKTACSNCNLRELCLPFGLSLEELERLADEQEETEIVCGYCNSKYLFSSEELRKLTDEI